jgi:hypothetical protein
MFVFDVKNKRTLSFILIKLSTIFLFIKSKIMVGPIIKAKKTKILHRAKFSNQNEEVKKTLNERKSNSLVHATLKFTKKVDASIQTDITTIQKPDTNETKTTKTKRSQVLWSFVSKNENESILMEKELSGCFSLKPFKNQSDKNYFQCMIDKKCKKSK